MSELHVADVIYWRTDSQHGPLKSPTRCGSVTLSHLDSPHPLALAYLTGHGRFRAECCGGHLGGDVQSCVELVREKYNIPNTFISGGKWE